MGNAKFQFQSGKSLKGEGSFPDAVHKTLEQFQSQVGGNLRRGAGTVTATVTVPEEGAYFGIVLAGPFRTIEALKAALDAFACTDMVEQMRRIGIE